MTLVGYLACSDIKSGKVFLTLLLNISQFLKNCSKCPKERLSVIGIVPLNPLSHGLDGLMNGCRLFERLKKKTVIL